MVVSVVRISLIWAGLYHGHHVETCSYGHSLAHLGDHNHGRLADLHSRSHDDHLVGHNYHHRSHDDRNRNHACRHNLYCADLCCHLFCHLCRRDRLCCRDHLFVGHNAYRDHRWNVDRDRRQGDHPCHLHSVHYDYHAYQEHHASYHHLYFSDAEEYIFATTQHRKTIKIYQSDMREGWNYCNKPQIKYKTRSTSKIGCILHHNNHQKQTPGPVKKKSLPTYWRGRCLATPIFGAPT